MGYWRIFNTDTNFPSIWAFKPSVLNLNLQAN